MVHQTDLYQQTEPQFDTSDGATRCASSPRRSVLLGALLSLIGCSAAAASAQDVNADALTSEARPSEPRPCSQGGPLLECSSFFIFELRGHAPFVQSGRQVEQFSRQESTEVFTYTEHAFAPSFGWELGYAWNLNQTYAAGGTVGMEMGGPGSRLFVRARGRRWLSTRQRISLEVAPGLSVAGSSDSRAGMGATADVRINIQDRLALLARYDVLNQGPQELSYRRDPGGLQHAFSVGAVLGSRPALWGTGVLGAGYLILLGLFLSTYG